MRTPTMIVLLWTVLGLLAAGCGRSPRKVVADGGGASSDWWVRTPDGRLPGPDSRPAVDRGPGPSTCAALSSFAAGKRVLPLQARKVLIPRNLDRVVVLTDKGGGGGDLWSVPLPSGVARSLATEVHDVQWLDDRQQDLLVRRGSLSASTGYGVEVARGPSAGTTTVLAKKVCGHRALPDGSRVYVVRDCSAEFAGTLDAITVAGGGKRVALGTSVDGFSLVAARNSQVMAFIDNVGLPHGCSNPLGRLRIMDRAGTTTTRSDGVRLRTLQFAPDSAALFYQRRASCAVSDVQLRVADVGPAAGPDRVISTRDPYSFGYIGTFEGDLYTVTPNGKSILAGDVSFSSTTGELVAIHTDGSGTTTLAKDLFPFPMISMAFVVWTLTADAGHVVYASVGGGAGYPAMGLSSVPISGGTPTELTAELMSGAYAVSPSRATDVAYITRDPASGLRLRLGAVGSTASRLLYAAPHVSNPTFVPGGRGLLVTSRATPTSDIILSYVSRTGGPTTAVELGGWIGPSMGYPTPYATDPTGCVVAFNRTSGKEGPGTYLRLIPN